MTLEQATALARLIEAGHTQREAAVKLGVSDKSVWWQLIKAERLLGRPIVRSPTGKRPGKKDSLRPERSDSIDRCAVCDLIKPCNSTHSIDEYALVGRQDD